MILLANAWAAQGRQVTLLTLDDGRTPPFSPLHVEIEHHPLDLYAESGGWLRRIRNNLRRMLCLRRAIVASGPDVIVCFMDRTNVLTLFATLLLPVPVIVAEHTAVGTFNLGRVWELMRYLIYPRAAAIVVLTERACAALPRHWRGRTAVIPNPVVLPPGPAVRPRKGPEKYCIAMGSLRAEKGFDLLLQAFALISPARSEWRLSILGSGPLRAELEQLAEQLGIADRVHLLGLVDEPRPYLVAADFFVLSSRREGFPLALCEAMACGLPAVAFDCQTGPREIVRPGRDGLLVPPEDVLGLADAMTRMMDDEPFRQECARSAPEVLERFSLQRALDAWELVLQRAMSKR